MDVDSPRIHGEVMVKLVKFTAFDPLKIPCLEMDFATSLGDLIVKAADGKGLRKHMHLGETKGFRHGENREPHSQKQPPNTKPQRRFP